MPSVLLQSAYYRNTLFDNPMFFPKQVVNKSQIPLLIAAINKRLCQHLPNDIGQRNIHYIYIQVNLIHFYKYRKIFSFPKCQK